MEFITSDYKNAKYLTLKGQIENLDDNFDEFNKLVKQMSNEQQAIILDLSQAEYIDSMGVGTILTAFVNLKRNNGLLIIYNPSEKVDMVFRLSKMHLHLPFANAPNESMDSGFGPFALTRLCYQTGGIYFTIHPNRRLGRRVGRRETEAFSSHFAYFFDPQRMRPYRPEYDR